MFVIMFASTTTTDPTVSITYTQGSSPTPMQATVSVGGTLIYDSYRGIQSTWSHWFISDKISVATNNNAALTNSVSTSWLNIFVPILISTDAGTIYCAYSDGGGITSNIIVGTSSGIILSLNAKSASSYDGSYRIKQKDQLFMSYLLLFFNINSIVF